MWRKRSLTGCDGPDFASASHTCLVNCVDVAVIVGGGLQVSHHSRGVGEGKVEHVSSGLREHLQKIVLCRRYHAPLYTD